MQRSGDLISWTMSRETRCKGRSQEGVWKKRGSGNTAFLPAQPRADAPARDLPLQVLPQPAKSTQSASPVHLPHATSILLISGWLPRQHLGTMMGSLDQGLPTAASFTVGSSASSPLPHLTLTTGEAGGHHSRTISAGLVTYRGPSMRAAGSATPVPCSQDAHVLLGPKEDNPEPKGPSDSRGELRALQRQSQDRSTCLVPLVPNQVASSASQWLLEVGRLVCKSGSSTFGGRRFPGHLAPGLCI